MIESFNKIEINNNSISCFELTLMPKDTLVLKFDQEIWDINEANKIASYMMKLFPENKIMVIFNGIKLGVIHNVD